MPSMRSAPQSLTNSREGPERPRRTGSSGSERISLMISKLESELDLVYRDESALPRLISIILPFNERPFTTPPQLNNGVYWRSPLGKTRLLALHDSWRIELGGKRRFTDAREQFQNLLGSWQSFDPEETGTTPRILFQYAFSEDDPMEREWQGLPNSLLLLPRIQLLNHSGLQSIVFSHVTEGVTREEILQQWKTDLEELQALTGHHPPETTPSRLIAEPPPSSTLHQLLDEAIAVIRTTAIEKIVVGEQHRFQFNQPLSLERTLRQLEQRSPESAQFAFSYQGRHFIAAPPEKLFSRHGNTIQCDALAGTLPRGTNPTQESKLEQQLLNDTKLRHEHQLVVDAIEHQLAPLCNNVTRSPVPQAHKLENIQHLLTSIRGELAGNSGSDTHTIFDLIAALHQSPAICGTPRENALQWLKEHDNSNRGGYCGGAGWIDRNGDGEIHVLLRCAVVEGAEATLYAGAGITEDSIAEAEAEEINLKIRGMLNALTA